MTNLKDISVLDFGFAELVVIIAVAVLVIGPAEIPAMMHGLGRIVRRLQYVRYAFSQQFEDFMRQHDLDDIRNSVNFEARDFDEEMFDEAAGDEEFAKLSPPEKKKPKKKTPAKKAATKKASAKKTAPKKRAVKK